MLDKLLDNVVQQHAKYSDIPLRNYDTTSLKMGQHQRQLQCVLLNTMTNPGCGSGSRLDSACVSVDSVLTAELCGSLLACGELPVC